MKPLIASLLLLTVLVWCDDAAATSQQAIDAEENIALATPFEEVASCSLGRKGEHAMRLLRRANSTNTGSIYYLQKDAQQPVLYNESPEYSQYTARQRERESTLEFALAGCQGSPEKIFVVTTAHNGRLLYSRFIRYNSYAGEWQSFEIGSMEHPVYAYLSEEETIGVSKNDPQDRKKLDELYLTQKYQTQKGLHSCGSIPVKALPPQKGYQVILVSAQIQATDAGIARLDTTGKR